VFGVSKSNISIFVDFIQFGPYFRFMFN